MVEKKTCPKCGMRTMIKEKLLNGKFTWKCQVCGLKRGEFKEDTKKGVV
jgi:ribosomal protein L37AE/L43A